CRCGRTSRDKRARRTASGAAADDGRAARLPAARPRDLRGAAVAVFTRLLVGLDGSPRADSAFEQAVVLGQRFGRTVVVAYVREPGRPDEGAMLERARERLLAAGLTPETVAEQGDRKSTRLDSS